jgi:hypothetical protein
MLARPAPHFLSGETMNPVKQIGRYQLPILNVFGIRERRGLLVRLKLRKPGYDAILTNGHVLHFTEEEKQQLDEARAEHEMVMEIYGMARGLGLRT